MKKNIFRIAIPALACTLVLTGGLTAFAEDNNIVTDTVISAPDTNEAAQIKFAQYSGIIGSVVTENGVTTVTLKNDEKDVLVVNLPGAKAFFDAETKSYINISDLKEGDKLTVVLSDTTPMTASLPPMVSEAEFVIRTGDVTNVKLDVFDKEYLASSKDLVLNMDENTYIVDSKGTKMIYRAEDIVGKPVAVVYTKTTFSIPAQTPPDAVIILDNAEEDMAEETTAPVAEEKKITFVGLRDMAVEAGYAVKWVANDKPITLTKEDKTIEVTIGSASVKVNGEAQEIVVAPRLSDSVTLVDSSFSDLLK